MVKQSLEDSKASLTLKLITLDQAYFLMKELMNEPIRTFRTDRLSHQFLKPKGVELYQNLGDGERLIKWNG